MKKKIIFSILFLAIIGFSVFAYFAYKNAKVSYTPQKNLQAPIEIPADGIVSIQEANSSKKPQVVLFYVDWCGYCRKFMPVFGEFAKKYGDKYSFTVVNCDNEDNKEMVEKFHIIGFPLVFIVDNETGHRFTVHPGATADKDILTEELENYFEIRKKYKK